MTFEVGDEVVMSEFGLENNEVEYNEVGVIIAYEEGVPYPYSVEWPCEDHEVYSSSEIKLHSSVPKVPTLKGYALWISKQEVTAT